MTEERVTTYETPEGGDDGTIQEGPVRSSVGMGWLLGILFLIAMLVVVYLMAIRDHREATRDNTVTGAAIEGEAAVENPRVR